MSSSGSSSTTAGVIVAPAVRDLDQLGTILVGWLHRRMPAASDIHVSNLAYPRGAGQSHETILFDADWREGGAPRSQGMVVRIKPTSHTVYQDDMFTEQYRLMGVLHDSGIVPASRPMWFEEDPSVLGAPFFVMEKLHGRVAVTIPSYMREGWVVDATPAQRSRMWEDGVRSLAKLQKIPLASLQFIARPEDGATGFEQEWGRWRRFLDWVGAKHPLPFHELAFEKLRATWPANRPPGLSWGDARLGNMMINDDFQVIAIMDLEQTSLGGALQDLGWFLSHEATQIAGRPDKRTLDGFGSREDAMAIWREVTGYSTDDLDWYQDFATFKRGTLAARLCDLRDQPILGLEHPLLQQLAERLGI